MIVMLLDGRRFVDPGCPIRRGFAYTMSCQ